MELKYEVITTKSFLEAEESIKTALTKRQFGILWELNFKDKLAEKNLVFNNRFKIFEICLPQKAHEVLSKHLDFGYFLPCRVVVYEQNEEVKVGFVSPSYISKLLGYEDIKTTFVEIEKELINALEEIK